MTPGEFQREYGKLVGWLTVAPPEGFPVDNDLSVSLPSPLRFVLSWAGRSKLNQVHNQLLDPSSYSVDEDGMVTFAIENQSVVSWGFPADAAGDDPPVYQRAHGEGGDGPWVDEGKRMSEFLFAFTYWNAAYGGADATVLGEVGTTTDERLRGLETVFATTDFSVRRSGDVFFIATRDDDFYAFGKNQPGLKWLVQELNAAWADYEQV